MLLSRRAARKSPTWLIGSRREILHLPNDNVASSLADFTRMEKIGRASSRRLTLVDRRAIDRERHRRGANLKFNPRTR